jgi:hypothetical protein
MVATSLSDCVQRYGGESGIRTGPFFELSCYHGDGENPCEHSHSNTISFPSYLSNVAWFNCISVFLELMELMRPFLFQWTFMLPMLPLTPPELSTTLARCPGTRPMLQRVSCGPCILLKPGMLFNPAPNVGTARCTLQSTHQRAACDSQGSSS